MLPVCRVLAKPFPCVDLILTTTTWATDNIHIPVSFTMGKLWVRHTKLFGCHCLVTGYQTLLEMMGPQNSVCRRATQSHFSSSSSFLNRDCCCCCCCEVASVLSDSVWPHRQQPTRFLRPLDSPGKTISFSNACMHAKSLQSCPALCDPMDSSLPGSSVHGIL